MVAWRDGISLLVFNSIACGFAALIREISSSTLKEKFHISMCPYSPYIYSTSYATLSSGMPWNIPRVPCIFWFSQEPLGECVYQENTSDEWGIPWLYHEKVLHNYFIPCHRKYSGQQGQHDQCEIRADLNG